MGWWATIAVVYIYVAHIYVPKNIVIVWTDDTLWIVVSNMWNTNSFEFCFFIFACARPSDCIPTQRKPPFLLPFLGANCLVIVLALIGIATKFVSGSDTSYDIDDDDLANVNKDDPMKRHKTLYTIVAICYILLSCHAWLVIFALWKQDSSAENKIIDSAIAMAMSNYPTLQSVASIDRTGIDSSMQSSARKIDDGLRLSYN